LIITNWFLTFNQKPTNTLVGFFYLHLGISFNYLLWRKFY
jgi:hypothetical protein